MVAGAGNRANPEAPRGQSSGDGGRKPPLAVAGVVDALEEDELGGIERRGRVERAAGVLDRHVGVSDDPSLSVQVLRGRVVGAGGVGEGAELHVVDLDLDVKGLAGLEHVVVLWVEDHGRDHAVGRRDLAHGCPSTVSQLARQR